MLSGPPKSSQKPSDRGKTVTKPISWAFPCQTRLALVRLPVQLLQRLPFHLQFHLRVFLKHLRIALPERFGILHHLSNGRYGLLAPGVAPQGDRDPFD
jgi:hypothetical protein